ncbi:MAG TPA: hypothetical protein VKB80_19045 [Kofleriaceae bacterium]|nr:hypothetical protein [Kofleriaceae bacterium]
MATWQFDCVLFPRTSQPRAARSGRQLLRDGSEELWSGRSLESLVEELEKVLGKADPTWTPDVVMWGANDSTCLLLAAIGGAIEELRLRIDMRVPEDDHRERVLGFARKLDLVVATEVGDIVEPRLQSLMSSAARSRAGEFVKDPERYLAALESVPMELW